MNTEAPGCVQNGAKGVAQHPTSTRQALQPGERNSQRTSPKLLVPPRAAPPRGILEGEHQASLHLLFVRQGTPRRLLLPITVHLSPESLEPDGEGDSKGHTLYPLTDFHRDSSLSPVYGNTYLSS